MKRYKNEEGMQSERMLFKDIRKKDMQIPTAPPSGLDLDGETQLAEQVGRQVGRSNDFDYDSQLSECFWMEHGVSNGAQSMEALSWA